jgi:hypothetical protein
MGGWLAEFAFVVLQPAVKNSKKVFIFKNCTICLKNVLYCSAIKQAIHFKSVSTFLLTNVDFQVSYIGNLM